MTFLNANKRLVIIGLDGVPYSLVQELSVRGEMPNMFGLTGESTFCSMKSSIPDISCVAWSSIMTGKNPGEHGIFGFMDMVPGSYNIYFPNYTNLSGIPFWNWRNGTQSVIINVPSTYPASPLNGVLISGFVAPELDKAVWPPSLIPELKRLNYRVDVDSDQAHQSMELFIDNLNKTLAARIDVYRHLWEKGEWDIFMLVFTGTDRLGHFLWEAYQDETHPYHKAFLHYFNAVDQAIGEIVWRMRPDDSLIVISDHGFESMKKTVYINSYLRKNGFLRLKRFPTTSYDNIDGRALAFAMEPARICVNTMSKYPRGNVKETDKELILTDLIDLFGNLEIEGEKVIKRIYRKEEIYNGPFLDRAADLVLVPHSGFDLKARLHTEMLAEKTIFTGKHSQDNAFLLIKSPYRYNIPEDPSVVDVFNIVEGLR
ncbi:MAG: alkaline phosphatase family protein [Thermodesulfobacteriota bacterium]|nr:alkaline phosphatase family protein [Thermodesulfobacteriota bacterium]